MATTMLEGARKKPGRPKKAPGSAKEVRACLRTTPQRLELADAMATKAGLSRNAWIEQLIDNAAADALVLSH